MAGRLIALAILAAGCGGPAVPAEAPTHGPEEVRVRPVRISPAGSRLSLEVPASLERVRHALRWRGEGLDVRLADAEVEPGEERAIAEAYVSELSQRHAGELSHRPAGIAAARGVEATIQGETERVRTIIVWSEGAVSRLTVIHPPDAGADAERIIDSVRFDPERAIDPVAALQLRAAVPEGLGLIPVTNEQLLFRAVEGDGAARAVGFPHAAPVLDVAVIAFPDGDRPPSDVVRGQLLGSRFAGLELGSPQVSPLAGRDNSFAIITTTPVEGVDLSLFGAYLEGPDAVVLVRASVAAANAEEWIPRFAQLTMSIGFDG